ncbi:unnamed protein product [Cyprideis torosa]|uniref:RNA-binding protein NOB1 n=1 Tax=Cyprideis torosa TaxID=163714 RepID=A0A7R8W696_9CRUS|nr:unnamed protein product [Cyprideis torosa]CAG0881108.1 unnamed protein product [Cyprideis torosa]
MSQKVGAPAEAVVVDTGAFLKLTNIQNFGKKIYSVESVVQEVKDVISRRRLSVLPYDIEIREPDQKNISVVSNFSKKTGDFPSLSATDIRVLALTLELQLEAQGGETKGLRLSEPRKPAGAIVQGRRRSRRSKSKHDSDKKTEKVITKADLETVGFVVPESNGGEPDEDLQRDIEEAVEESESLEAFEKESLEAVGSGQLEEIVEDLQERCVIAEESEEGEEEEEADDEGWITPHNLNHCIQKAREQADRLAFGEAKVQKEEREIPVACMTTDFAMQNVLIQMGLALVSVEGCRIRQTRTYLRRCFACFKTTEDMCREFCPSCGHRGTLKRVSLVVKPDGTKVVQINFRKPLSTKGMRYSRALPRSGKHAQNEQVAEDQRKPQQKPSKKSLARTNVLSPEYTIGESPFAEHDVNSRAFVKGYTSSGFRRTEKKSGLQQPPPRRRNPNEPKTSSSKRNKKVSGF